MNKTCNSNLTKLSQQLRKNMTKEEKHLWYDFLKFLPIKFNRQKVIGEYIVDFYCSEKKLVIEIDGTQHYFENGKKHDQERDEYLRRLGLKVVRYSNADIKYNFENVCSDIIEQLK